MKVLILANSSAGLYMFRRELLEQLVKEHQVIAYSPNNGFEIEIENIGCKLRELSMSRRGKNFFSEVRLIHDIYRAIKTEAPDLVITYTIKPNLYGGILCRLLGITYAVNITGLGTAFQRKGALQSGVVLLYKVALKKAKVVFFENDGNREIFIDKQIVPLNKTCLLMGAGVNLERYQPTQYPPDLETRFLFMGRVMKEKGIDELFEAMHRLYLDGERCSLDVIGSYVEHYEGIIAHYEEEGWLHYHGFQENVKPFIANCHCFVLPSWHEGMANTNLECAASGRPVITSNIHGCLEAVEDGVSGYLCESKNADSLYQMMKRFSELPTNQRVAMGLAGRKRMEEIFDKKKVVEETIARLF